jgi:hypothetical protein
MKKLLTPLFCVLFYTTAFCQSLSFKQLNHLTHQADYRKFLLTNQFTEQSYSRMPGYNVNKNAGTGKAEAINVIQGRHFAVTYATPNSSFINALLAQIKQQYPQIIKDESKDKTFYQFGDTRHFITIDIYKNREHDSLIMIVEK